MDHGLEGGQRGRAGGQGLGRVLVALGCLVLAIVPARVFVSDGALRDSARAFARGDCAGAVERGLDATEALASRAEPYAILGYCDGGLGVPLLGVQAMEKAIVRDPRNWAYHYGRALARGAAGLDPRPAARRALELNPRAGMMIRAVRSLRGGRRTPRMAQAGPPEPPARRLIRRERSARRAALSGQRRCTNRKESEPHA